MSESIFHAEFSSADASALSEANSRFTMYPGMSATSTTLGASDTCFIYDATITTGAAALVVQIYDGSNNSVDAGETIVKVSLAANSSLVVQTAAPHQTQKSTYPKVKTNQAGQVDVTLHGRTERVA